jgi:autotransporter-associated beta strand protein
MPLLDSLDIIGAGQVLAPANYVAQTIRFNTPNGGLVNANGNNMDQFLLPQTNSTFSTTGILVTPNVGSSAILITANSDSNNQNTQLLTSGKDGTGPNMVIWQNNTQGDLILNTGIADSSAGPLSLSIEGLGMVAINATSTYTGSTTLQGASVQIPYNAALGNPTSPIDINGGTLISQQTLTLDSGGTSPIARSIVVGPSGAGLIASAGTTLTIDGPISGSGTITVGSTSAFTLDPLQSATSNTIAPKATISVGTVVLAGDTRNFSGGISVQGGTLQFAPGSGTHTVSSLVISPGSELDITNNSLVINYGSPVSDPAATIRGYLQSGYNNDMGDVTGITSSFAGYTSRFAVGYADGNTDAGTAAVVGDSIGATQILVKYTLKGDASLDGIVNFPDLLIIAQDYGKTGQDWARGDFNYDGTVNFPDLLYVAMDFGDQLSALQVAQLPESFTAQWQLAEAEIQASDTNVPEPATTGLLAVGAAALMARRRRPL